MLIKEYRIPLPVTVEEYRIAQLYMIAKKSRQESKGAGSGVEILVNEPYNDGPGGNGQYTRKIYHVGSHLPSWIKALLPKSALITEEESWNAYPYTKTRFTCPFMEKFSIEIETYYLADNGYQDNVFELTGSDLRNRVVDLIDILDNIEFDCIKEEDPHFFVSKKSNRGPLEKNWIEDYWAELKGQDMPLPNGKAIMCAYKLCRVEFRYWGMQTKLEKFIHDVALRRTMLQAHRQAWIWQDEWHGLTMEDIREIERQTQVDLKRKMDLSNTEGDENVSDDEQSESFKSSEKNTPKSLSMKTTFDFASEGDTDNTPKKTVPEFSTSDSRVHDDHILQSEDLRRTNKSSIISSNSNNKLILTHANNYLMESIVRNSDSDSDDEFFDCQEKTTDAPELSKWSSLEILSESGPQNTDDNDDSIFSATYLKRVASDRKSVRDYNFAGRRNHSIESEPNSPIHVPCSTTVLLLVLHSGSVLDSNFDNGSKKSDLTTFRGAFESVMRQHYPSLVGHISMKLVSCPSVCSEALAVLSSLSPYSFDGLFCNQDIPQIAQDSIPIGAIPLLSTCMKEYKEVVKKTTILLNSTFQDFIKSEEGTGFNGQIFVIGDSMGSVIAYDILCKYPLKIKTSANNIKDLGQSGESNVKSTTSAEQIKLDFEVCEMFMFGSPLSLVLAYRKILKKNDVISRPNVQQVYNLFHPTNPVACRLEPLISAKFASLAPVNVPRYAKYPLGNGQPYHLLEVIQSNPNIFMEKSNNLPRRMSEISLISNVSGTNENISIQTINSLQQKWWGNKRLDYALYCPEGLSNFSTNALPHLFHASYWESSDVIAFVLRQIGRFDNSIIRSGAETEDKEISFRPKQPREKWNRKRTSVKLKNVAANHRANDIIVKEGTSQVLTARFMYGPLDMITLTGEKVDIHVMKDFPSGEWIYLSTETSDKTGRVTYTIPEQKSFSYGLFPVKMVVRGDHTSVDFFLAVVPPRTECIVFSIDGSFTASVSVTGRDPKVRAGAVDVVRHWQELGYLIIYITGRPDMQQHKVVSWLSQHNFPHGLVSFADGLSTDPLGHKAAYLSNLIRNHGIIVSAAYGSSKDISVYQSINVDPKKIFIIGSASKKHHSSATILSDGYVAHLSDLNAFGGSRPAQGNARMVLPRGYFCLPGQKSTRRKRYLCDI